MAVPTAVGLNNSDNILTNITYCHVNMFRPLGASKWRKVSKRNSACFRLNGNCTAVPVNMLQSAGWTKICEKMCIYGARKPRFLFWLSNVLILF